MVEIFGDIIFSVSPLSVDLVPFLVDLCQITVTDLADSLHVLTMDLRLFCDALVLQGIQLVAEECVFIVDLAITPLFKYFFHA